MAKGYIEQNNQYILYLGLFFLVACLVICLVYFMKSRRVFLPDHDAADQA